MRPCRCLLEPVSRGRWPPENKTIAACASSRVWRQTRRNTGAGPTALNLHPVVVSQTESHGDQIRALSDVRSETFTGETCGAVL